MDALKAFPCFRLKSERRKIRLRKTHFEKTLLALDRKERQLSRQIRNLGYEPLIPPVQKGWKRTFVLREEVKRSTRAEFFQALLDKINTVQYSAKKGFTKKKRRRGRKVQVPREQQLRHFYEHEWRKMKLSEPEAQCFIEKTVWLPRHGTYEKIYECNEPWRFVLKVMPNMITEKKVKDALLEQQVDYISNYLDHNRLRPKLQKLLYGQYLYRDYPSKPQEKNPLTGKPLYEILSQLDWPDYTIHLSTHSE